MRTAVVAALCAGTLVAPSALAQEGPLTLGGGLHYSSGDYGTTTTTTITTLEATARYEAGRWTYKATLPYLFVSGATSVVPGIGNVRGKAPRTSNESGMGDIVVSATYAAYSDKQMGIDLTGKVKLPSADEAKGLGTGETDVAFLVDGYRTFERITGFGGIGYHILGDSPGLPLENAWSANLGASYKLDERDSVGALFESRQRVVAGGARQLELIGFFMRKLDRAWKAQAYALIGLADGSPDWGIGATLGRPF